VKQQQQQQFLLTLSFTIVMLSYYHTRIITLQILLHVIFHRMEICATVLLTYILHDGKGKAVPVLF
jgi:hypothetical protein